MTHDQNGKATIMRKMMVRCDYSAPLPASGWCALWGCKPAGQVQQPFEVILTMVIVVIIMVTQMLISHSQVIGHWECLSWC